MDDTLRTQDAADRTTGRAPRPLPAARRGVSLRALGIAIAVATVLGVAAYATVVGMKQRAARVSADDDSDIFELLGSDLGGERGSNMMIQLADEKDPTRLAAVITAERFEPISPEERRVERPRGIVYLDDGRELVIQSDRGRLVIPPGQQEPSSGILVGAVTARVFPPGSVEAADRAHESAGGEGRPPIPGERAELRATFDEAVDFDLELARLRTEGGFEVTSAELDASGRGLRVVLNELRSRLERLEVGEGRRIVLRPGAADAARPDRPAARDNADAGGEAGRPGEPPPTDDASDRVATGPEQREELYRLDFRRGVRITRADPGGLQELRGDRLEAWVRLIDGRLSLGTEDAAEPAPDRASREPAPAAATSRIEADAVGDSSKADALADSAEAAGSVPAGSDAEPPVVLTWTGPLRITPLDPAAPPPALAQDDAAILVTAPDAGGVTFRQAAATPSAGPTADAEPDVFRGGANEARYFASREIVRLTGRSGSVWLEAGGTGRLAGVNRVDLNARLGMVHVRGPGGLYRAGEAALADPVSAPDAGGAASDAIIGTGRPGQRIEWTEQADFLFAPDVSGARDDGAGREAADAFGQLESASMLGRVRAFDSAGDEPMRGTEPRALASESLDVRFTPHPITGEPTPVEVRFTRGIAEDGRGGSIAGDDVRVAFEEPSGDPSDEPSQPTIRLLDASGSVIVRGPEGDRIAADELRAWLTRDRLGAIGAADGERGLPADRLTGGRVRIERALATGNVRFSNEGGTDGKADEMEAWPGDELVRLTGGREPESWARASHLGSTAVGPEILVNGAADSIRVVGPGAFDRVEGAAADAPDRRLEAGWTQRMSFDGRTGVLDAEGSVWAQSDAGGNVERMRGDRVIARLDPANDQPDGPSQPGEPAVPRAPDLRARESDLVGTQEAPAWVESLRSDADRPSPREDVPRGAVELATPPWSRGDRNDARTDAIESVYLEGRLIRLRAGGEVLEVPGPGRMHLLDRTAAEGDAVREPLNTDGVGAEAPVDPADPFAFGGGPGHALFTWDGGFRLDRADGVARMERAVRIGHVRFEDDELTKIEAEEVLARFADADPSAGQSDQGRLVLEGLTAAGAVYIASGGRELIADRVIYDPETGVATAAALEGNRVYVYDDVNAPLSAAEIRWNLLTDRIDVLRPGGTAVQSR